MESAVVGGVYWFSFASARDLRTFVVATLALHAALGAAGAAALALPFGPRRGWQLWASLATLLVVAGQLLGNFPSAVAAVGGRAGTLCIAGVAAAIAGLLAGLLAELPLPGGAPRPPYVAALVLLVGLLFLPERLPQLPASSDPRRPDVLLVVVDTLRADAEGFSGDPEARTPHLDRLARRGTVMEQAISASNSTPSSFASLLSGVPVSRHGVRGFHFLLDRAFETLPELLGAAGYRTFGVSSSFPAHLAYHQFDQGMARAEDDTIPRPFAGCPPIEGLERLAIFKLPETAGLRLLPQNKISATREADLATDAAAQLLPGEGDPPTFLLLHYIDPHTPYSPPRLFSPYAGKAREILAGDLDERLRRAGQSKPPWLKSPLDVRDPRFVEDAYRGEVTFTDHEIGRLLAEVARRGRGDRTLVLFTADHGEALLEHAAPTVFDHKLMFDTIVQVPLLLAGPGIPAAGSVREVVRSIDHYATVADLLGITLPPGIEGRSYRELLEGRTEPEPRVAISEAPHHPLFGVRKGDYKLLRNDPDAADRLHDVVHDPAERCDVAAERPEVLAELQGILEAEAARGQRGEDTVLQEEQVDALRSLGYVDAGGRPAHVPARRIPPTPAAPCP